MTMRTKVLGVSMLGAMLLVAAGCGGGDDPPLVLGTRSTAEDSIITTPGVTVPVTSATAPSTAAPTTTVAQLGPWVDVTSNLAGMASECGNVGHLVADPARDRMIIGVAAQGLWADDPGSGQWTPLGSGAGSAKLTNRVGTIVFDPLNPDQFWEGGNYGDAGAFATTDAGLTFRRLGDVSHLDGVSVDLSDPGRQTLLAGAHERSDVYRSTDGGESWTSLAANLPADIGYTSQPLVLDAETHLLGTYSGSAAGILRSTDGGATWQEVSSGGVVGAPLVSAVDGSIFWLLESGGVVSSPDGGSTWTQVTPDNVLSSHQIIELPDGRLASVDERNVMVSDDRGATWLPIGPNFPTAGAYGVAYSAPRNAFYVYQNDCGDVVPAGSVQRLDLTSGP